MKVQATLLFLCCAVGCPAVEGGGDDAGPGDGAGDDAGNAGIPFHDTYALMSGGRCDGCHEPATLQGDLDLSSEDTAYAQLVDVVATGPFCGQTPHTRVVPGDADGSLLIQKLSLTQDCGLGMPEHEGPGPPGGAATFTADELATVRAWIEAGAAR